jgi:phosphoenolpyruvate phosphomutase / 2-hydroxyethylphosphonate cytidylyltransferase
LATAYVGLSLDVLHHGHINVIEQARRYGDVMIGLLTDQAIASHKRIPYLNFEQRKKIAENIIGVKSVVPQETWDYGPNLLQFRPEFMIHGDDWLDGPYFPYRQKALEALAKYGGKLIEIPYTKDVSCQSLTEQIQALGTTSDIRRLTMRRLLAAKPMSRFIEVHSPMSALIAEHCRFISGDQVKEFDGFWSSSLTDSTLWGKPDTEALDISSRLSNIAAIFDVTTKPMIFDGDTGGKVEHFKLNIKSMDRLGISAVIIEDKKGLKKNSLLGNDVEQTQEDIDIFCEKIIAGRKARISDNFMVIARIESLVLNKPMEDALERARAYIDAGADALMIHSRSQTPTEIFQFSKSIRADFPYIPLVCVPTTYNRCTEDELAKSGFNVVIYANHLLRAAFPSMERAAIDILRAGRSMEIEERLMKIDEILKLIPGTN